MLCAKFFSIVINLVPKPRFEENSFTPRSGVKALFFAFFLGAPFSSKTKDARARKISAVDPVVSQLVSLSMFLESGY